MTTTTLDFESLVETLYEPLYRFAMSLSGQADQAADLTQQTFYRALTRGGQLRDPSKAKSWLFTILYREFLGSRRHRLRHPTQSLDESDPGQLVSESRLENTLDSQTLVDMLAELDEHHRVPLILFYQEDYSYREIADFLNVPLGTVMSRLNRGKLLLRERLNSIPVKSPHASDQTTLHRSTRSARSMGRSSKEYQPLLEPEMMAVCA